MLEFDENHVWGPQLSDALKNQLTKSILNRLATSAPQYIEDARDLLFELTPRNRIIDATLAWLRSTTLAVYHGTRLTDADIDTVCNVGLLPLNAKARRTRIVRALSPHKRWPEVAHRLDATLDLYGTGNEAGKREGQVHLTLSRNGFVGGFKKYLTYGAECDYHVAKTLLEDDGLELLRKDGTARLIRVAVPGDIALCAAHPHFSIEQRLANGDVPHLVDDILKVWSYSLSHPDYKCGTENIDCGLVFYSPVSQAWIVDIETVSL